MKKQTWTSDWMFSLLFSLVFVLLAYGLFSDFFEGVERAAYDAGVRMTERQPDPRIAVIAIDDQSIDNIGRWPWPRSVHAEMIDLLQAAGARSVGYTVMFLEPQRDPGLEYIRELRQLTDEFPARNQPPALARIRALIHDAEQQLDTDRALARSLQAAGNTTLAMSLVPGEPRGRPDAPPHETVTQSSLFNIVDRTGAIQAGHLPRPARALYAPLPELATGARALGHLNVDLDADGGQRRESLVYRFHDHYLPSMALQLARVALNLEMEDIEVRLGEGIQMGGLQILTANDLRMNTHFYRGNPAFMQDSFHEVLSGRIPAEKYRDRIVLVGATAAGVGQRFATPVSSNTAPVLSLAHSVSSILQEDFFVRPAWAPWLEAGVLLLLALYLIVLVPRINAGPAASLTALLLIALIITHFMLMVGESMHLRLMLPALFLVLGHMLVTIKRFRVTEKLRLVTEAQSAESNKMLGLALQQQGQLDMAFDKFRQCPLDDPMMDVLYNLALDFERKRQFNKAGAVYRYMAGHNADYRDLRKRMQRSETMENTVMLGGGRNASGPGTLIMGDDEVQKPMLGRYEIEKELGKGAMGAVYLGRDPKINRMVAIKTMALADEFDEDELEDVRQRFFREAETAGRLTHPAIVTIHDAGEEQDLAYIAMEFLRGHDLTRHIKPDTLLPLATVFDIVATAAEALDYAHNQNVVHRDIKPANIMYESDSGQIKLTDFGIARITDSSKTKTGMILGTPSYMSPEQLAGHKVDGRSDLFSLGVTFYQLASGQLPFTADSMATLMYRISNEPHGDIRALRPELPACLTPIIDRLMAKDPEQRYQNGNEAAADIRRCAGQLAGPESTT